MLAQTCCHFDARVSEQLSLSSWPEAACMLSPGGMCRCDLTQTRLDPATCWKPLRMPGLRPACWAMTGEPTTAHLLYLLLPMLCRLSPS